MLGGSVLIRSVKQLTTAYMIVSDVLVQNANFATRFQPSAAPLCPTDSPKDRVTLCCNSYHITVSQSYTGSLFNYRPITLHIHAYMLPERT